MISSISLHNYKAFSNVTIPLRPLTILLGANSVGKSSILQMLMLLHQTVEERGYKYSSALKIYGNYVNVGAYENLFKAKNTKMPLGIEIDIESISLLESIRDMKKEYIRDFQMLCRYFPLKNLWELASTNIKSKKDFLAFVKKVLAQVNKQGTKNYKTDLLYFLKRSTGFTDEQLKKYSQDNVSNVYDFLSFLETELDKDILRVNYEISLKDNKLVISKLAISTIGGKTIIRIVSEDNTIIDSDLISIDETEQTIIGKFFRQDKPLFDCINTDENEESSPLAFIILQLLSRTIGALGEEFSEYKVNYVSPLRAHPKRYYMLDKAKMTISLDTLDGDAIAEVLKENEDVKRNVNSWFSKFGFKIDVKGFKEVIHHVNVTQNNLSLDITDVGFGISQVLPIIIQGFLSMNDSITIVEQPEIHLHPMMQADLGDLFIDITKKQTKKLVIETHSEYMLKRIRRRISEGVISPSMVSICLFHPKTQDKDAWVEHLEIGEKGSFEWPEEFYGGELYNDTIEFLKNQS